MCRIAGIVGNQRDNSTEIQVAVKRMTNCMAHGGPDDAGFYDEPSAGVYVGHRRLSLLDLSSAGHQPMATANGKNWITFNGEVYNFKDIRTQLIAIGYTFKSNSDTEVILQAYDAWGEESFVKFNGMFAFGLYDGNKQLFYLVRDAAGIKPLYYHLHDQKLTFASEIKAFLALDAHWKENDDWKIYFLTLGNIPEPFTTLQHV
ncbi:MAG: asparagine synthetase B, partial [Bacteroidota bacterium]